MAADDLHAYAICTLLQARQWIHGMGTDATGTDDTLIKRLINAVTDWIEADLHRRVIIRSAYITEYFDGDGTPEYYVDYPPIVELNEIKIGAGTTTIKTYDSTACADTSDVRFDSPTGNNAERGRIVLVDGYTFGTYYPDDHYIKYKGGWYAKDASDGEDPVVSIPEIPRTIFQACLDEVKRLYKKRERLDTWVASKSLGVTGESISFLKDEGLTQDTKDMISYWRRSKAVGA